MLGERKIPFQITETWKIPAAYCTDLRTQNKRAVGINVYSHYVSLKESCSETVSFCHFTHLIKWCWDHNTPQNVDPAFGCWHRVKMGRVVKVSEECTASVIRKRWGPCVIRCPDDGRLCSFETSARQPTSTLCHSLKAGLTLTMFQRKIKISVNLPASESRSPSTCK
jgi:hypothetical protein